MTMSPCEHIEVMDSGVCVDCGEQVVLTGQVPVEPEAGGTAGSAEPTGSGVVRGVLQPQIQMVHRAKER